MAQMQFTAVAILTLLLLKLLVISNKVALRQEVRKARWLMTLGIALLDLQFLLQYLLGLRAMGVTQAVLVNLVLFIPCTWTISLSILQIQTHGNATRLDKFLGGGVWALVLLILGTALAISGQPLLSATPELYWAEVISSIFYMTLQGHYAYRITVNLRAMRLALRNYYDHDMDGMLEWMRYSTIVLTVLSFLVPLLIFVRSAGLAVFALLFFVGIFYMVDSFCNYMVSSAPRKMMKAEEPDTSSPNPLPTSSEEGTEAGASFDESSLQRVEHAVERWIQAGGYRRCGLNIPNAADEIGIPRYLLSAWLKQQGLTYSTWMTDVRIDEAKRVLVQHPEWNNEAVASHCGFRDRTYFQKKFKEITGLSPAEFAKRQVY